MFFSVLTLFPELVDQMIRSSITGRALDAGLFAYRAHNIRDAAQNRYGRVDDSLYGGGTGMLMMCQPVYDTWFQALDDAPDAVSRRTIYLSPKGRVFQQSVVADYVETDHLVLLCGHYEGVDQRVLEAIGAEELSIGDFVLTGGELAAGVVIDAVARQLPGVLPSSEAFSRESHYDHRLECRQYTKPPVWQGRSVPAVLQSGHHARIESWRELDGLRETLLKRPDLFSGLQLTEQTAVALVEHCRQSDAESAVSAAQVAQAGEPL